jgi:TRAP-type C4-dicarboxylate transport system substrate-binding protein
MKKYLSLALALTLVLALFAGCNVTPNASSAATQPPAESTSAAEPAPSQAESQEPAGPQPVGPAVTLTFGNASPPDKLNSVVMEQFCKDIEELSGGSMTCEWYPAEQLGSSTNQIESMMGGNQSGNLTGIDVYGTYVNDLNVLSVPFLFEDIQHQLDFLASETGSALLEKLASEANLKIINYNFQRLPRVLISTSEIKSPADLRGKAFRVANIPMQQKMFSYWGGSTNQISFAEYPMALMQGVVNAGETSCESFSTSKFHLYAPYIAEVNFAYPLDCICMSNQIFESLTPEQQEIIYKAAETASDTFNSRVQQEWEEYRPTMIEEGAVFCEVDIQEWRDNMVGFYDQLNAEGFFEDPTLIDYIRAMR